MKTHLVKDLMVPIAEYATVPEGSTLFEAVQALEKAQEEYDHTVYKHRAVLVMNGNGKVIGKLSHMNVLLAIEPKSVSLEKIDKIKTFGFSPQFISTVSKKFRQDNLSSEEAYRLASRSKVEEFMKTPSEGEYVDEDATMETAIDLLNMGKHASLLVTRQDAIVGVLRMTDVFGAVFHMMKFNEFKEKNLIEEN